MTNPFDNKSPADLLKLVQEGVECSNCFDGLSGWLTSQPESCLNCHGSGHTPLPNADLDAIAAKWCMHLKVRPDKASPGRWEGKADAPGGIWVSVPTPTTDPVAAMRLQVKYRLTNLDRLLMQGAISVEAICHTITTAALIAALTEAIQKEACT